MAKTPGWGKRWALGGRGSLKAYIWQFDSIITNPSQGHHEKNLKTHCPYSLCDLLLAMKRRVFELRLVLDSLKVGNRTLDWHQIPLFLEMRRNENEDKSFWIHKYNKKDHTQVLYLMFKIYVHSFLHCS